MRRFHPLRFHLVPRTAINEMILSGTALAASLSRTARPAASAVPLRCPESRQAKYDRFPRRAGFLAVSEMLVVLAAAFLLLGAGPHLLTAWSVDIDAYEGLLRASSDRPVYRLAVDQTSDQVWVFRPGHEVTLLNPRTGRIENTREVCGLRLTEVAHSRDGSTSLLMSNEGEFVIHRADCPSICGEIGPMRASVVDAAVAEDGSRAVVALSDGTIHGWNLSDHEPTRFTSRLPHSPMLSRMALSARGDKLFAAFSNGTGFVFDPLTGRRITEASWRFHGYCTAATWSQDGRHLATATSNADIELFDTDTGRCIWKADRDVGQTLIQATAVSLSPDGRRLAVCGLSRQVLVCDMDGTATARRLTGHAGVIRAVAFSRDGASVFSGSFDGSIREWSADTGAPLKRFD